VCILFEFNFSDRQDGLNVSSVIWHWPFKTVVFKCCWQQRALGMLGIC